MVGSCGVLVGYYRVLPGYRGELERTAAAVGRGLRGAVPSCAGKYASGASGSNVCPAGSRPIETEAACRTTAAAFGKNLSLSWNQSDYPRGCSYLGSVSAGRVSYVYFNAHPVGNGRASFMPLCAADTTLPPTGAPRAQNAHAPVPRHCALPNARAVRRMHSHDRACAVCARRCGGVN